jgi:hypothetical protein
MRIRPAWFSIVILALAFAAPMHAQVITGTPPFGSLYFGLPTSRWQLRVYQKTDAIVRVEFVLRLSFLRSNMIEQPVDVLKLSEMELWRRILPPCSERRTLRDMHRSLFW